MIKVNEASKTKLKNQWITMRGSHYHVDKNGNIDIPRDPNGSNQSKSSTTGSRSKSSSGSKSTPKNNDPSELANMIAQGIKNAGEFAETNIRNNVSHNKYH